MTLSISVTPETDLIDVPRRIRVCGVPPGASVTVTAETAGPGGSLSRSEACFEADARGEVDLWDTAPSRGDYDTASPMGLVWSQHEVIPGSSAKTGAQTVQPIVIALTARSARHEAKTSMVQILAGQGVTRRPVQEDGVTGVLYMPQGPGPHPGIVILNGSGGGMNEPRAALYASRGYAALALGFFRAPGRPDWINDTPLEYFRDSLAWFRRSVRPKNDFVALTGQSRGGELVLLLAATFPDAVSAVMAYVPASCIHSAQSAGDPALGRLAPTWTLDGKPLPHLWDKNRTGTYAPYDNGPEPRRHEYALLTAMADQAAVERARIKVENIRAPVLLINGTDDGWWPTDYHCAVVAERMAAAGRHVERLRYEGAGHSILFPYVPTTGIDAPHPVSGIVSTNGGTAAANARADEGSWAGALDFLHRMQAEAGR